MIQTRRQHTVWRFYLEAWADCRGSVPTYDRETQKNFETNPINVAVERDFYEWEILNENEVDFIDRFLGTKGLPVARSKAFQFYDSVTQQNAKTVEEDFHSRIEQGAVSTIGMARTRPLQPDELGDFLDFLSIQYFRTSRIRAQITEALNDELVSRLFPNARLEILFNALRIYFYFALSETLRKKVDLESVEYIEGVFITSDQPVVNIAFDQNERCVLWYPLSPTRGMLIWDDGDRDAIPTKSNDLNSAVSDQAKRQIFGHQTSAYPGG